MPEFKLKPGGVQDKFLSLRTKIQLFGGGFGNGKTTAGVAKALMLAKDYPGSNGLMARSTYPKLNDTLRKEFLKWTPKKAIKSFPMSVNASNTCLLENETTINFRYIAQQGKNEESTTSNLLSATYDWIIVDQAEDPEITYKDFLDLLGRLRGRAPYRGDDPSMPRDGPRYMMLMVNPTRNWIFTELVEPLFRYTGHGKKGDPDYYEGGEITDKLLCYRGEDGKPVIGEDGKPILLIGLVEGSTYENQHNLAADFIATQSSTYQGQMRDRYLLGKWAAYEGLVYPQWDHTIHMHTKEHIEDYLAKLINQGYDIEWVEGYDYGIASPSCYLLGFTDPNGNLFIVDGFYRKEFQLPQQYAEIKRIRNKWGADLDGSIDADPDIFRRKGGGAVGTTVANLFWTEGNISVRRAQNDITHGIAKVSGYLNLKDAWPDPITLATPSPSLFVCADLTFIATEMSSYYWKKSSITGERTDEPQGTADHALDTIKYMLTTLPDASQLKPNAGPQVPSWMLWHEGPDSKEVRSRRHG